MPCEHCSGKLMIKALLIKDDREKVGFVPTDLVRLSPPWFVKLDGEGGWHIETAWIGYSFWEKELKDYNRDRIFYHYSYDPCDVKMLPILNVERDE